MVLAGEEVDEVEVAEHMMKLRGMCYDTIPSVDDHSFNETHSTKATYSPDLT